MTVRYRSLACGFHVAALASIAVAAVDASAEGGPPLLTDDPGTVDVGHWEINLAWTSERAAHAQSNEAPLIDINYGLAERLQLKFEMPWVVDTPHGTNGFGTALVGVKWRFFDQGEHGWQVSTYPQIGFLPPGLHHAASAEPGVSYLLPLEVQRNFDTFDAGFEIGRTHAPATGDEGWIAGVTIGRKVSDRIELLGELHDETVGGFDAHELVFNVGTRATLSEHFTLLASLGTDVENTIAERNRWISYLGLQLAL